MSEPLFKISPGNSYPYHGALGCIRTKGSILWYGCRESFNYQMRHTQTVEWEKKRFIFNLQEGVSIERMRQFFEKLEALLKIKSRTQFTETSQKNSVIVNPCRWWFLNNARFGVLSIFLRSGNNYLANVPFKTALLSHKYALETIDAMNKFLDGYTHFEPKGELENQIKNGSRYNTGWKDMFVAGQNLDSLVKVRKSKLLSGKK